MIRRSAPLASAVRSAGGLVCWTAAVAAAFASRASFAGDDPPAGGPVPAVANAAEAVAEGAKYFEQGEVLREEGKWHAAADFYGKSLDADEGAWLTHVRYQEAVIRDGKGKELVAEYDDILKTRPTDPQTKLHRLRIDPPAERLVALTKLSRERPSDPYVLLELGRAQLATRDAAAAKRSLEAAFGLKPADTGEFLMLSVEALLRLGDVVTARDRLEATVKAKPESWVALLALGRIELNEGRFAEALARAERVLSMRPSYLAAFLVKSEAASRLGKSEDALTALESALRVNPADLDGLLALADLVARAGTEESLKKAVDLYKKAVAVDPTSLRAQYGLGWAHERQNLLPESLAAYREALGVAPTDSGVANSVGYILLKQRRFQDAVVQFTKAIDLDPQSPDAYNNMGAVSDAQSDYNEAIKWYTKVLHLRGHEKNIRALLNAAFDYEALGSFAKAEDFLVKARSVRPEDDDIITVLGDNLYFQKKFKPAIKAYQDAVKINPKNRFAWRGMGFALAQDDRPEDAIDALEHSKALKADDQTVLLILGDLYLELENLEKSLENYEAYVKAGGNDPDIPPTIEELKKEIAGGKK